MQLKTILYVLSICMVSALTKAQKDTSVFRFSAWQVDLATPAAPQPVFMSQTDLRALAPQDTLLNINLVGYEAYNSFAYYRKHFTLLAGARMFFQKQKKKTGPELYIGFKYGQTNIGGSYFQKTTLDSSRSVVDTLTGRTLLRAWSRTSAYSFSIWDHRIYLPLGGNLKTDDTKRFWINFGFELCPIFSFGQRYTSVKSQNEIEQNFENGSTTGLIGLNGRMFMNEDQKIKGLGFGMYASCPINFYFQPFVNWRRFERFKGLNLGLGLSPLYLVSKTSYLPLQTALTLNSNVAIRWRLAAKS